MNLNKCFMKNLRFAVLLIPVLFAVFAVMRWGFLFRAGVSASCAIIVWFMTRQFTDNSKWYLIAALLISIGGDWFMSHTRGILVRFIYGVCLFFVAHLGFIGFCLKNGRINRYVLIPLLTAYLFFFFIALRPAISHPVEFITILAYLIISCFSFALATGLRLTFPTKLIFSFGIALLVFSDTLIALKNFAGYKDFAFLILPTYFASHIVITLAIINTSTSPPSATSSTST